MKTRHIIFSSVVLGCTLLSSCIWQPIIQNFTRDQYPGPRPPMVIADKDGSPASNKWLKVDDNMLPPSTHIIGSLEYAEDGLPYGLTSEFSNVVISPYAPHYQLDYTGIEVGSKVWDPYTRKAFYIKRTYTFN
ncbi:MAG: hypothetical protein IKZ07_08360 [Akkermansia sp.]|nr:hypothetical protein [Akkermansia sp.]